MVLELFVIARDMMMLFLTKRKMKQVCEDATTLLLALFQYLDFRYLAASEGSNGNS